MICSEEILMLLFMLLLLIIIFIIIDLFLFICIVLLLVNGVLFIGVIVNDMCVVFDYLFRLFFI